MGEEGNDGTEDGRMEGTNKRMKDGNKMCEGWKRNKKIVGRKTKYKNKGRKNKTTNGE